MAESTEFDPTDTGTLRPNAKPLQKKGTQFQPMECPDFDFEIRLPTRTPSNDPFALFTLYYTPELLQSIVTYTNSYIREPRDPSKPKSRALQWYPTCVQEIYVFFAIRIYMTIYPLNKIEDYWDTRLDTPYHHFTKFMARDRFQELRMRYRTASPEIKDIYKRVSITYFAPTFL